MICNPFSSQASPAVRRYTRGVALAMSGYVLAVLGTSTFVHNHPHPRGPILYLLSALPSFCIFAMLAVVVTYLRDEHDEYQRMLAVRSIVCAAFAILAMSAYTDFLRSYGHVAGLPPFTDFVVFWIVFGIAQAVQSIQGRSHE
jgi:formate-dependent nitrite reductase membrane component NrfD